MREEERREGGGRRGGKEEKKQFREENREIEGFEEWKSRREGGREGRRKRLGGEMDELGYRSRASKKGPCFHERQAETRLHLDYIPKLQC